MARNDHQWGAVVVISGHNSNPHSSNMTALNKVFSLINLGSMLMQYMKCENQTPLYRTFDTDFIF